MNLTRKTAVLEKLETQKKLINQTGFQLINDLQPFSLHEDGPAMQILGNIGAAERLIANCIDIIKFHEDEESSH